jgi:hypothetical protein
MRNAGLIALAFAVLSIREAASQQTPAAEPTWTPSPECVRLRALRAAHPHHDHIPWTPEEIRELKEIKARVGGDGCAREEEQHEPTRYYKPEWGPRMTPAYVIRRILPLPTPDACP